MDRLHPSLFLGSLPWGFGIMVVSGSTHGKPRDIVNAIPREPGELSCPQEVKDQLAGYGSSLGRIMGGDLAGAYLYGSLARGCYHPGTSDIDVLVVLSKPPADDVLGQVSKLHREAGLPIDATFVLQDSVSNPQFPVSVEFFIKPNQDGGIIRVPEGSGHVLLQHQDVWEVGVPLVGPPVRDVFRSVPWRLLEASLVYVFPHIREHFRNPVLSLARIVFAHTYRSLCSKRQGGDWALRRLSEKWHPLIKMDLDGYAKGATGLDAEQSGILGFEEYCSDCISDMSKLTKGSLLNSFPIPGDDLIIRAWTRRDVDLRAAWPPYPSEYSAFTSTLGAMSQGERDDYFQKRDEAQDRISLTADLPSDPCIALVALIEMDWEDRTVGNMGVRIRPDCCDKGIGTRLLKAIVAHFGSWGISRFRLDVAEPNTRAIRCYEKVGFYRTERFDRDGVPFTWMELRIEPSSAH